MVALGDSILHQGYCRTRDLYVAAAIPKRFKATKFGDYRLISVGNSGDSLLFGCASIRYPLALGGFMIQRTMVRK